MTTRKVSLTKWLMWWSWLMGGLAGAGIGMFWWVPSWYGRAVTLGLLAVGVTFFWVVWFSIKDEPGECGDIVKGVGIATYCCRREFGHRGYHTEGTVEWTGMS